MLQSPQRLLRSDHHRKGCCSDRIRHCSNRNSRCGYHNSCCDHLSICCSHCGGGSAGGGAVIPRRIIQVSRSRKHKAKQRAAAPDGVSESGLSGEPYGLAASGLARTVELLRVPTFLSLSAPGAAGTSGGAGSPIGSPPQGRWSIRRWPRLGLARRALLTGPGLLQRSTCPQLRHSVATYIHE